MVLTGAYNSNAHVINMQKERVNTTIDVSFMDRRGKQVGVQRRYKGKRLLQSMAAAITAS